MILNQICQVLIIHPILDSWEDLAAPLMESRDGLKIANIGDKILAFGGEYRGRPVNGVEEWKNGG